MRLSPLNGDTGQIQDYKPSVVFVLSHTHEHTHGSSGARLLLLLTLQATAAAPPEVVGGRLSECGLTAVDSPGGVIIYLRRQDLASLLSGADLA